MVRLDRTIQSKGKASTPKWHATYIKRIRPSSWCPVTAGILRLGGAPFDKASSTAALIYRRSSVSCSPIGRVSTSFLKVSRRRVAREPPESRTRTSATKSSSRCLPKLDCDQKNDGTGRSSGAEGRSTISPRSTRAASGHCGPLRLLCNTAAQFARRQA